MYGKQEPEPSSSYDALEKGRRDDESMQDGTERRMPRSLVRVAGYRLSLAETLLVAGILLTLALILFPIFAYAHDRCCTNTCLENQHRLMEMLLLRAEDHHGLLPDANTWLWHPDNPRLLVCPAAADSPFQTYGYNTHTRTSLAGLPRETSGNTAGHCQYPARQA